MAQPSVFVCGHGGVSAEDMSLSQWPDASRGSDVVGLDGALLPVWAAPLFVATAFEYPPTGNSTQAAPQRPRTPLAKQVCHRGAPTKPKAHGSLRCARRTVVFASSSFEGSSNRCARIWSTHPDSKKANLTHVKVAGTCRSAEITIGRNTSVTTRVYHTTYCKQTYIMKLCRVRSM